MLVVIIIIFVPSSLLHMLVGGTHTHNRRTAPVAASHAALSPPARGSTHSAGLMFLSAPDST
jgi:hypothetical protein